MVACDLALSQVLVTGFVCPDPVTRGAVNLVIGLHNRLVKTVISKLKDEYVSTVNKMSLKDGRQVELPNLNSSVQIKLNVIVSSFLTYTSIYPGKINVVLGN